MNTSSQSNTGTSSPATMDNGLSKLMSLMLKPDPLILSVRGNRGLVLAHIDIQAPASDITSNCSTPLPTPISANDHRPSSRSYVYEQQNSVNSTTTSTRPTEFYGTGELRRTINDANQQQPSNSSVAQIIPCPFFPVVDEDSRFAVFSNTGRFFVYHTIQGIKFLDVDAHVHLPFAQQHPDSVKARRVAFSPRDTYLVLWDAQQLSDQQTSCKIYRTDTLDLVGRFIQFQRPEWAITWSHDEQLMVRQSGGEIWFHESAGYLTKPVYAEQEKQRGSSATVAVKKLPHSIRLDTTDSHIKGGISISPYVFSDPTSQTAKAAAADPAVGFSSTLSYFIAMFHQSSRDRSGFIRMYKYPNIETPQQAVQQRVIQQQDHVQFVWNARGTHCLAQAWAEIDVTSKNYYGAVQLILFQAAHVPAGIGELTLMSPPVVTAKETAAGGKKLAPSTRKTESAPKLAEPFTLQFKKDGPIHAFKWFRGRSDAFVVTYGNMPNVTGLFDCNGTEIYSFATNGYTNGITFNPFGNILLLYGSGNVQPSLAFWDVTKWRQPKALTRAASTVTGENIIKIDDMTYVEWAPDGIHLVTATTTPRLRINNGFKIVHFSSGQVLTESSYRDGELYQVQFRPQPDVYNKPPNIKREARVASLMLLARNGGAAGDAATILAGGGGEGAEVMPNIKAVAPTQRPAVVNAAYVPPHMRKAGVLSSAPKYLIDGVSGSSSGVIPVGVEGENKARPALPPGVTKAPGAKGGAAARPPRVPVGMTANNGDAAGGGGGGGKGNAGKKRKAKGGALPAV